MDTNKNSYTVIYATILVVVVAALLAIVSLSLKPLQDTNVEVEKQMQILGSANLAKDIKSASNKNKYVQDEFSKYITKAFIVDANGNILKEFNSDIVKSEAFKISPKEQYEIMKKIEGGDESAKSELMLPVYYCSTPNENLVILSCYGQGLWGPIWGYIGLKEDLSSVTGILFDHESETPGLGAEITSDKFQSQFAGKENVQDGAIVPMIKMWLKYYEPYINSQK